ncbi:hypothetical protein HKX48_000972 [Thoreauomyces humboldtii]|nr:hypothetical protein HKX48_000972 [Thoreauomyces humboldtii]
MAHSQSATCAEDGSDERHRSSSPAGSGPSKEADPSIVSSATNKSAVDERTDPTGTNRSSTPSSSSFISTSLHISKADVIAELEKMGFSKKALPEGLLDEFILELKSVYQAELGNYLEEEGLTEDWSESSNTEDHSEDDAGPIQSIRKQVPLESTDRSSSGTTNNSRVKWQDSLPGRDVVDGQRAAPSRIPSTRPANPGSRSPPRPPPVPNEHATSPAAQQMSIIERLAAMDLERVHTAVQQQKAAEHDLEGAEQEYSTSDESYEGTYEPPLHGSRGSSGEDVEPYPDMMSTWSDDVLPTSEDFSTYRSSEEPSDSDWQHHAYPIDGQQWAYAEEPDEKGSEELSELKPQMHAAPSDGRIYQPSSIKRDGTGTGFSNG